MGYLLNMTIIVICIDAVLFLGMGAALDLNPQANAYGCSNGLLSQLSSEGCNNMNLSANFTINSDKGKFDTIEAGQNPDILVPFINIYNWASNAVSGVVKGISTGIDYFTSALLLPYHVLKATGLPGSYVFTFAAIWYLIHFFVIMLWIKGGVE